MELDCFDTYRMQRNQLYRATASSAGLHELLMLEAQKISAWENTAEQILRELETLYAREEHMKHAEKILQEAQHVEEAADPRARNSITATSQTRHKTDKLVQHICRLQDQYNYCFHMRNASKEAYEHGVAIWAELRARGY